MPQSSEIMHSQPTFSNPALAGVEYASVAHIAKGLEDNAFTSRELVDYLVIRIATQDRFEAVIEVNPDAQAIAQALDAERAAGQLRGPLHGIAVLLKDNIGTGDQMQTSAGSLAMVGDPAADDAFVVSRLRAQGAIILGKTNMSEWANFRGDRLPDGWSGRGGQTLNPYKPEGERPSEDICGSSSGSAAAVAAGFAPLALATDTYGSIACPASRTAVVGLKPSVGLLSRSGVVPSCEKLDSVGPMARSVFDAALLLNALAGVDAQDPATQALAEPVDYTALLGSDNLRGKRIGYSDVLGAESARIAYNKALLEATGIEWADQASFDEAHSGMENTAILQASFDDALREMAAAGAILVPVPVSLAQLPMHTLETFFTLSIKRELPDYLASRNGLAVRSLDEVVTYNEQHPGDEGHNQAMLQAANSAVVDEATYAELWQHLHGQATSQLEDLLQSHSLDALVHDSSLSMDEAIGLATLATAPGITVPSGVDENGRPTALYFYGARWSEAQLLAVAHGYEQASLKRRNPNL